MRCWNTVRFFREGLVCLTCRGMLNGDLILPLFPPFLTAELMISDRHQKKEIRQLEQELPRWQVLVDNITGVLKVTHPTKACVCLHLLKCVLGHQG